LDELVCAVTPGKVARVEPTDPGKMNGLRRRIYEAAARVARPVEVWEGPDGALWVGLSEDRSD
jgi:hypothetical protein